jgi:hypothetical protein
MPPITITTLTPQAVQQSLQNNGLAALGLTTVALGTRWCDASPAAGDYNQDTMLLNIAGLVRAPFLGIRENAFSDAASTIAVDLPGTDIATSVTVAAGTGGRFPAPTSGGRVLLTLSNGSGSTQEIVECTGRTNDVLTVVRGALGTSKQHFGVGDKVALRLTPAQRSSSFYEADGTPVNVPCTVFRFHPEAYQRLLTVSATRYGSPLILPMPAAMIVRNAPSFRASRWYRPDEQIDDATGQISFHDERGFIIDPVYVAGLFADLLGAFPAFVPASVAAAANGAGGVQGIAGLATGVRVHFIDPHGNTVRIASQGAGMVMTNGNVTITGNTITLASGDTIAANNATTPLRFGWATNGLMGTTALNPPALATGNIGRRFYRVMVVDTAWYLLGNRTGNTVLGIGPDDGRIPPELLPAVRDQVNITYFVDGPDTLAEATRILTRASMNMILAVSPTIDPTLLTAAAPGPNAHWPAFPLPNTNAGFPAPPARLTPANVTAAFTSGNDVVVTIAGGAAPDGATVRIFPQQFVEIASINGSEPSFLRGDGGSAIVSGATPTQVLLKNPFALGAAQPKPSPAVLTMDIVVAPRNGRRRLTGAVAVTVAAGPVTPPATSPFFGPAGGNIMGTMPGTQQGVAESPLFGIPTTITPAPANPNNFLDLVLSFLSEASPRQAPRLPTMARFETIAVTGVTDASAQPSGSLLWQGTLSGARWSAESRSAQHAEGNPGNPAGPDLHAPGVSVTGALGYDLALHAARRAQSIIPRPLPQGGMTMGWVAMMGGNNFAEPSDAANNANTGTGVLLESIASGCETSWLSSLTTPPAGLTADQLLQNAATAIGVTPPGPGAVTIQNEARLQKQVRREFFAAKQGFRDAQWSLRRAFAEARELVYIESPQFSRTARAAAQAWELDLVAVLAARLGSAPNLRVIVCTPRFSDFSDKFRTFHRQHYQARMEALGDLQAAAKDRVLLFHPVGFPGRVAYIRTTSIIVDDVWSLVGPTHFRRRGMTFDGSAAIASFDRQITNGYSTKVRDYRRALMAAKLNVPAPAPGQPLSAEWVRLGRPASAFDVVKDLLDQGGFGRIQSIWPGPPDNSVLPAQPDVADPDGSNGQNLATTFAAMLNEAGT